MGARGVLRTLEGGRVAFMCPGCKEMHHVRTCLPGLRGSIDGPSWQFNGDYDRPTFSPSVLVRGHAVERDDTGRWTGEWLRDGAGNPISTVCHSFVRDGQIQFLGDCTHPLAGQTVPLQSFDD
jgi:hypothetical protein